MKNIIRIACILTALLFANGVSAHGDHGLENGSSVSMVEAAGLASREVTRLVEAGKIDGVWAGKPLNASMEQVNNQRLWIVTATTKTSAGEEELQIFLSSEGYVLSYGIVAR
ncbi:DUF6488 family protein [Microbulbifer sp. SAOS-129_SWC]|uniref:DUF6488 family protein n=1 Tax=Microbulbifer sp. SAOS-129_SWC TaxID=3145235 RepID=UPI0032166ED9